MPLTVDLRIRPALARLALVLAGGSLIVEAARAGTCLIGYADLFDFNYANGNNPQNNLVADSKGNLYGTTASGGANSQGVVFKLVRPSAGSTSWTQTVLWSFGSVSGDGFGPVNGLLIGPNGALFGMTAGGGAHDAGVVFQLTPPTKANLNWTETILYNFGSASGDGAGPFQNVLVPGPHGALYGATSHGGTHNFGTLFQLTPPGPYCAPTSGNAWCEKVLYSFQGGSDGESPLGALAVDFYGNLYGATLTGGSDNYGVVFELSPPTIPDGPSTESVLYSFSNTPDGANPQGGVTMDSSGVLYGTTGGGGLHEAGTMFELRPPTAPGQPWTEATLYRFGNSPFDGAGPTAGVSIGAGGVLFGTTAVGGTGSDGAVFSLTPPASAEQVWGEAILYNFPGGVGAAARSRAPVLIEGDNVFGTASGPGANGPGFVWEINLP
jgi:uncharacterized repeat protein (TIGR03803 family)